MVISPWIYQVNHPRVKYLQQNRCYSFPTGGKNRKSMVIAEILSLRPNYLQSDLQRLPLPILESILSDIHKLSALERNDRKWNLIEQLKGYVIDLRGYENELYSLSPIVLNIILSHVKFSNDLNQRLSKKVHTIFLKDRHSKGISTKFTGGDTDNDTNDSDDE